jgi:Fe-S oxidoreductase
LRDARLLLQLEVASVETLDAKILSLARSDTVWLTAARFFPEDDNWAAQGVNIVEVLADTENALANKIAQVTGALAGPGQSPRRAYTIARNKDDIQSIWSMRKRAVGLLGNVEGERRPVAFVEDTAVPPDHLANFIKEFRALLDAEGLEYGMFGHVDAGVLHVRPALDLSDPAQALLIRKLSDAVVALTLKYNGVFWGEHGKGVRSEYVPNFFGQLYPCLQQLKAVFDPHNQLNPGKIATPGAGSLTKIDEVPIRGEFDRQTGVAVRRSFGNAGYCNGNGACFDFNTDSAMCPSFKGTGDRRYSPKGRASLIREWLRLLAIRGIDPQSEAKQLGGRLFWRNLVPRLINSVDKRNNGDFSHRVREVMDNCLACKACAAQCPVKVDVPGFRSKFLQLYYGRYLRPVKDPVAASIEHVLPFLARAGWLYNAVVESGPGKTFLRRVGLIALPVLSRISLGDELKKRGIETATPSRLHALSRYEKERSVVIVQDAFTSLFETSLVLDVVDLIQRLGFIPFVAPLMANGKALHVHGYLHAFARTAARTVGQLWELAATGVPLVGIDPSMTLCYRGEYRDVLGAAATPDILLPQEWLARKLDLIPVMGSTCSKSNHVLLVHCTEKTNAALAVTDWISVFGRFGIDLVIRNTGCCGMAGTFGHEVKNRALSETIYALDWKQNIGNIPSGDVMMVTGFSCRSQVKQMEQLTLLHPLQVLQSLAPPHKNIA